MPHGHASHHRHRRAPFSWPDPAAIVSALAAPFSPQDEEPKTITSVVYKTLAPTFDGPIGGYITPTTIFNQPQSTPKARPEPKETPSSSAKDKTTSHKTTYGSLTRTPTSIASPTSSLDNSKSLLLAKQTSSPTGAIATSNPDSLSQDSTATSGMTTGAKAGVAIGVICGVGAILLLVFFFVRQRKKTAERERLDDEKSNAQWDSGNFGGVDRAPSTRTARTASTAPRLSLRPVTQFLPAYGEKRSSQGNALQVASAAAPIAASRAITPQGQTTWERPMTANGQTRQNPFGNHAEAVDPVNAAGPTPVEGVTASGDIMSASGSVIATAAAAPIVAVAAVTLARGASKRGNGPKPLDFTKNLPDGGRPSTASPTGTEYSMSEATNTPRQTGGGAAIAAAGGPQNSAVHRVQLDFKPSMDDELELRAGQLIRLLHEYDDGWALCIRLDRSQQGVAPRTCLSTRPVKPRPNPGTNGFPRGNPPPGMRVPGHGQQGRPMSPSNNMGQRPQSPAGYYQGRPMTPTGRNSPSNQRRQERRITPPGHSSQLGQQREERRTSPPGYNGPSGQQIQERRITPPGYNGPSSQQIQERRITPPGPSRMNPTPPPSQSPRISPQNSISHAPVGRKPVPGQAM